VGLYALDGVLYYEYSALLLKRDKIEVGRLPAGDVTIALEMRTPLQRAAPAQLKFWINGQKAATGKVERTIPMVFTASSLLSAVPIPDPEVKKKRIILEGDVPTPVNPPSGCRFRTRCPVVEPQCADIVPPLEHKPSGSADHQTACILAR